MVLGAPVQRCALPLHIPSASLLVQKPIFQGFLPDLASHSSAQGCLTPVLSPSPTLPRKQIENKQGESGQETPPVVAAGTGELLRSPSPCLEEVPSVLWLPLTTPVLRGTPWPALISSPRGAGTLLSEPSWGPAWWSGGEWQLQAHRELSP